MYGRQYFDCAPMRCKLSVESCADSHRRGLNLSCLDCSAGEKHVATAGDAYRGAKQGNDVRSLRASLGQTCIRCGTSHNRLISESLCVACYNRSTEVARGRNSKGGWPGQAAAKLRRAEALIVCDDPIELGEYLNSKSSQSKTMEWTRIDRDSALLESILTGRAELEAMLSRILPSASIVDFTERAIERPAG